MRGGRHKTNVRLHQREAAREREALERHWYPRARWRPELAAEVTHVGAADEPYHRWLAFRQGYAPALVRRFLHEASPGGDRPLLDPFSGSGTFVIECARLGRRAVGVDATRALPFLAAARFLPAPPACRLPDEGEYFAWLRAASHPALAAAALFALAGGVSGDGRPRRDPPPEPARLAAVLRAMAEDRRRPLAARGALITGDARALPLADESVDGMLTSPPYLPRYDYPRIVGEIEARLASRYAVGAKAGHESRSGAASPVFGAGPRRRGQVRAA
ncbi:MAG: hypothetical protein HY719_16835, partial [Planctomycetes bacterium]|nr:hypothetical protein [Planctomycetota bacterium]